VAVAENLAIGKNGRLPWRYSSDLKFFKQTTSGNAVVMGWNTWTSIGKPLPNRLNIILSRTHTIENQPSILLLRSCEEVLALEKYLNCDLHIIGGASIYEAFKNDIEKWIVTQIPQIIDDADTFMPVNFLENFELSETKILEDNLQVRIYQRS
jgi:dihydrofolate reductase